MNGFGRAGAFHLNTALLSAVSAAMFTQSKASGEDAVSVEFTDKEMAILFQMSPLPPVPADTTNSVAQNPAAAHLGQFLFFDTRFSSNGEVSCATCHDPRISFSDGKELSEGSSRGRRNSAALWNVAYNRWYFWDGRADTLWSQALGPLESLSEHGSTRLEIAHEVACDVALHGAYETIFGPLPDLSNRSRFPLFGKPSPLTPTEEAHRSWSAMRPQDQDSINRIFTNLAKCLAAYVGRIVSTNSPFDRFVAGHRAGRAATVDELSVSAQRGLKLFIGSANCRLCHSGPNFTDGEFHDTRVPPLRGGGPNDPGRFAGVEQVLNDPFNAVGKYSDDPKCKTARKLSFLANGQENWGLFKTPTLRNVAETAPYMHQGQLKTLREVILFYSTFDGAAGQSHHPERILVPLNLSDQEVDDLIAFLESLTGDSLPHSLTRQPDIPGIKQDGKQGS